MANLPPVPSGLLQLISASNPRSTVEEIEKYTHSGQSKSLLNAIKSLVLK